MIFIHLISAKDILDKERRHRDAKCSLTEVVHTVSHKGLFWFAFDKQ